VFVSDDILPLISYKWPHVLCSRAVTQCISNLCFVAKQTCCIICC